MHPSLALGCVEKVFRDLGALSQCAFLAKIHQWKGLLFKIHVQVLVVQVIFFDSPVSWISKSILIAITTPKFLVGFQMSSTFKGRYGMLCCDGHAWYQVIVVTELCPRNVFNSIFYWKMVNSLMTLGLCGCAQGSYKRNRLRFPKKKSLSSLVHLTYVCIFLVAKFWK